MSPTLGERRVDVSFNPSGDATIGQLKRMAADLIDAINAIPVPPNGIDIRRCQAVAMTAIEDGAMWAVKAAARSSRAAESARNLGYGDQP